MTDRAPLKLRFLGALIEQLGAQLYPGTTATIAELISNAWDADAKNVWVDIPLGTPWGPSDTIVVTDDGAGMSYDDAADGYLLVGRKRRVESKSTHTPLGRPLHGRKGIGKLAAFGAANVLECYSLNEGSEPTSFRLDYDRIRELAAGADYDVGVAEDTMPLVDPDGSPLSHGTRITLSNLKPRRALNEAQFRRSLARRFAIDAEEMQIHVNGELVERFDIPLEFRFPSTEEPLLGGVVVADDGWGEIDIRMGGAERPVRWWIGFTEKPLQERELQGLSVLANKKMLQRPFLFERTAGVQGQLGQEYIVGEVRADWLDDGLDIEDDLIQANRDQLQVEDERLEEFLDWGRTLIRRALQRRNQLRVDRIQARLDLASFDDLLDRLTVDEQSRMRRVVTAISKIPEIELDDARDLVQSLVDAHEDTIVRGMLEEIDQNAADSQALLWDLVRRFGLIDARRNQTIIQARLTAIAELRKFVQGGALEVPTIHEHIKQHPWLLDPRWYLLDDEVRLSELGIDVSEPDRPNERMDYLFALGPSSPYTHDELLVVEIKRGTHSDGRARSATDDEVSTFHGYVIQARESQELSGTPLRVTGLMIAQDYTQKANARRRSLSTVEDVRLVFSTWDSVLRETERLHKGWLAVTRRRAEKAIEEVEASA